MISYMSKSISLDSLSINDVWELWKCCYSTSQDNYLIIDKFFTKERNDKFIQYSKLFELFNIKTVQLNVDFSEDIPYEYIYPSNLHEIFPKLENYLIKFLLKKKIKRYSIDKTDSHYESLCNSYLWYLVSNFNHKEYFEDKDFSSTNYYYYNELDFCEISLYPLPNESESDKKERGRKIYNNMKKYYYGGEYENLNEEDKPILCVQDLNYIIDDYSGFYFTTEFLFVDSNNVRDIFHPILKPSSGYMYFYPIMSYILNLPICKQLKQIIINYNPKPKLTITIHPLLSKLEEGVFDNIEIFNIFSFIQPGSYPEYIQLFKDIITTHVFPNVTTLITGDLPYNPTDTNLEDVYSLITREHFPKLHIYDISHCINELSEYSKYIRDFFFPSSLFNIIDTILINNGDFPEYSIPLSEEVINTLMNSDNVNNIKIHDTVSINSYVSSWQQLLLHDLLIADTFQINYIYYDHEFDFTMMCNFYKSLNFQNLETLEIRITQNDKREINSLLYDYFSLFSTRNYDNISELTISEKLETYNNKNGIFGYINKDTNMMLYHFFSLFSTNVTKLNISCPYFINYLLLSRRGKNLPLWRNIRELTLYIDKYNNMKKILEKEDNSTNRIPLITFAKSLYNKKPIYLTHEIKIKLYFIYYKIYSKCPERYEDDIFVCCPTIHEKQYPTICNLPIDFPSISYYLYGTIIHDEWKYTNFDNYPKFLSIYNKYLEDIENMSFMKENY
ncbi:hypothetical protein WA158_000715 [Blastocystis sp. Blastoise]